MLVYDQDELFVVITDDEDPAVLACWNKRWPYWRVLLTEYGTDFARWTGPRKPLDEQGSLQEVMDSEAWVTFMPSRRRMGLVINLMGSLAYQMMKAEQRRSSAVNN